MPTVIDELIVRLGIDGSKFRSDAEKAQATIGQTGRAAVASGKGLEEVLQKTQASTDRRLKQTVDVGRVSAQQFGKFRAEVAGLFTTLATGFGLTKFVKDVASTNAGIGRLAGNIGISVKDLNTFQEMSKRTGGSYEGTGAALESLTKQFQSFSRGGPAPAVTALRQLQVGWADATGKMKSWPDFMRDLNRSVKRFDKPTANSLLADILPDQGLINAVELPIEEYDKLVADVQRKPLITDDDTKKAEEFQKHLASFEQSIRHLKTAIGNDLMPIFQKWMDEVSTWLDNPNNQKFVNETVHEDIKKFAAGVRYIIDTVKEWHGVALALAAYIGGRWMLAMTVGLGPVGTAIATIAAGFIAIQKAADFFDPTKYSKNSIFWWGMSKKDQLKYHDSPESRKARGEPEVAPDEMNPLDSKTWFGTKQQIASNDMSDVQKGFLDTIAGPESGGRYDIKNGGSTFSNFDQFPSGVGAGGTSTASGRYQFTEDTWKQLQQQYGFTDFSPKSQDAAAWLLARDRYREKTGGDLETDLKAGKTAQVAAALGPTWPSLPGGSQSKQRQDQFDAAITRNSANHSAPANQNTPANQSEPYDRNAPIHGVFIDPMKDFFNNNFGPTTPAPAPTPPPKPDPSLSGFNMSPSQRDAASNQKVSSNSSVETNINGPITINTQATDAAGIAKSLDGSLKKYSFVSQANTGLA